MTPKKIKRGDLLPVLEVEAYYRDRTQHLDIPTGTTAVFTMTKKGTATPKITRKAAEVISSANGVVTLRYSWEADDTDTAGDYLGEFELTLGAGPLTVPSVGYIPVTIYADLA